MYGDEISLEEERRRQVERMQRPPAGEASPTGSGWRGRTADDPGNGDGGADSEAEVNCTAYGYRRGVRERVVYCEFQRLQESWLAPGYNWLPCPVWKPSGTGKGRGQAIVLAYVTGLTITLRGRNLREMYERLLRQQVYRITEMGEEADNYLTDREAVVIYAIGVEEPKPPAGK
jgi:hypothetical protein